MATHNVVIQWPDAKAIGFRYQEGTTFRVYKFTPPYIPRDVAEAYVMANARIGIWNRANLRRDKQVEHTLLHLLFEGDV